MENPCFDSGLGGIWDADWTLFVVGRDISLFLVADSLAEL